MLRLNTQFEIEKSDAIRKAIEHEKEIADERIKENTKFVCLLFKQFYFFKLTFNIKNV
jgi:hypothetical protein